MSFHTSNPDGTVTVTMDPQDFKQLIGLAMMGLFGGSFGEAPNDADAKRVLLEATPITKDYLGKLYPSEEAALDGMRNMQRLSLNMANRNDVAFYDAMDFLMGILLAPEAEDG